jgi:cyclin H
LRELTNLISAQTSHSESADVADIYAKAKPHLRASRLTDLEFIYSPSQIALACFRMIDPSIVETWLGIKVTKLSSSSALVETEAAKKEEGERLGDQKEQGVLKMLQAIEIVIREVEKNGVDRAKVTEVDKRLKWAHNPEKDPNSAL